MTFITDVTSAPAGVISNLITDIANWVGATASGISRYRAYSRAEAALRALSDRELDDLGIGRSDIHARVWSNFNQR